MDPLAQPSVDPNSFEFDVKDAKLTPPLFSAGAHLFRVKERNIQENKTQTGHNLVITFESVEAITSNDKMLAGEGEAHDIPAGFTITKWFPLQQSENPKAPDFKAEIARCYMALMACKLDDLPANPLPLDIIGKNVVLQLVVKEDKTGTFGPSNEVKKFLPVG